MAERTEGFSENLVIYNISQVEMRDKLKELGYAYDAGNLSKQVMGKAPIGKRRGQQLAQAIEDITGVEINWRDILSEPTEDDL